MNLYIIESKHGEETLRRVLVHPEHLRDELPHSFAKFVDAARAEVLERSPYMHNGHPFNLIQAYIDQLIKKHGFEDTEDTYVYEGEFKER